MHRFRPLFHQRHRVAASDTPAPEHRPADFPAPGCPARRNAVSSALDAAYTVPLDTLGEHAAEIRATTRGPGGAGMPVVTDTWAMGMLLAKLPYNRATCDVNVAIRAPAAGTPPAA